MLYHDKCMRSLDTYYCMQENKNYWYEVWGGKPAKLKMCGVAR